jgi:hypothetical protein
VQLREESRRTGGMHANGGGGRVAELLYQTERRHIPNDGDLHDTNEVYERRQQR